MALIPYDSLEEADAKSAEWWVAVRGPGWQQGNVTTRLYPVAVDGEIPALLVPERTTRLDSLIIADELEPREAGEVAEVYPAWALGATYAVDDLVSYGAALYKCRQAHTAVASNWTPPNVPALWLVYRKDADQLLEWVAGEPVSVGTRRTYSGAEYTALQAHVTQSDWTPVATLGMLWSAVAPPVAAWAAGVAYTGDNTAGAGNGDHVLYLGNEYRCLQSHTSIQTWNPVATLNVLWALV